MKSPCTKWSILLPIIITIGGVSIGLAVCLLQASFDRYDFVILTTATLFMAALPSIILSACAFVRSEIDAAYSLLLSFPSFLFLVVCGVFITPLLLAL